MVEIENNIQSKDTLMWKRHLKELKESKT